MISHDVLLWETVYFSEWYIIRCHYDLSKKTSSGVSYLIKLFMIFYVFFINKYHFLCFVFFQFRVLISMFIFSRNFKLLRFLYFFEKERFQLRLNYRKSLFFIFDLLNTEIKILAIIKLQSRLSNPFSSHRVKIH